MVKCILDIEVSEDVLGWKLPVWKTLFLHRVLPSCGGLLVYLILICYDIALIYEHYLNENRVIAIFCTVLMTLPAMSAFIFTITSPPPGIQIEDSSISLKINKSDLQWIAKQCLNLLFFPIAVVLRYCHQIFWWTETMYACRSEDKSRIEEALAHALTPSSIELYLFLQPFIHSAPYAIFNIMDLLAYTVQPELDKAFIQAVSIIASTLRMASTATMFRRFEREKICGRRYPWVLNTIKTENDIEYRNKQDQTLLTPQPLNENLIQFSPNKSQKFSFEEESLDSDTSTTSSAYHSLRRAHDSDDEYIRPVSIIDRTAPRRRDDVKKEENDIVVQRVDIPPPPTIPAPRPGSIAMWAEKLVENAESIPARLSAPTRRRHINEINQDEPDIPQHVPRTYIRGLEPQDITAAIIQYLGWYTFFIGRLFSISVFMSVFPVTATIILLSHYQLTVFLLIVPRASTNRRGFYIYLAFIYLFCLMEFKIRFRHVRVWHVFWTMVCTLENIVFVCLWLVYENKLTEWWTNFLTMAIFVSMLLSYMCFVMYFMILKPKETIVYIKNKNINN